VAEHLLDGDEIDAALVIVGRAGVAQPVRTEPFLARCAFELEQIAQPVADRATVDRSAALVAEQCCRVTQPGADVIDEPAQDQIDLIKHRHPPRPRARPSRSLAEADMDLAERPPAEVDIAPIQRGGLLGPQPRQIQLRNRA